MAGGLAEKLDFSPQLEVVPVIATSRHISCFLFGKMILNHIKPEARERIESGGCLKEEQTASKNNSQS